MVLLAVIQRLDLALESIPVQPNECVFSVSSDAIKDLESHLVEMKDRCSVLGL